MQTTEEKQQLCLNCMECCKWLEFGISVPKWANIAQLQKFYEAHHCHTKVRSGKQANELYILVPCQCSYLTPEGCSVYIDRFELCEKYDGRKDVILSGKCKWSKE